MFEVGRKVEFRDEEFKSCIGTIVSVIDINDAIVTLEVSRDSDGKRFTVKKINPDKEHINEVEDSYRTHGRY